MCCEMSAKRACSQDLSSERCRRSRSRSRSLVGRRDREAPARPTRVARRPSAPRGRSTFAFSSACSLRSICSSAWLWRRRLSSISPARSVKSDLISVAAPVRPSTGNLSFGCATLIFPVCERHLFPRNSGRARAPATRYKTGLGWTEGSTSVWPVEARFGGSDEALSRNRTDRGSQGRVNVQLTIRFSLENGPVQRGQDAPLSERLAKVIRAAALMAMPT